MNKRNIITIIAALSVVIMTVALIINPALSVTMGAYTLHLAPAFVIGTLLFILGILVSAMTQKA